MANKQHGFHFIPETPISLLLVAIQSPQYSSTVCADAGGASSVGHFSLSSEQKPSSRLGGARSRTVVPGAEPQQAAPAKTSRKRSKGKSKAGEIEGGEVGEANGSAAQTNGHSINSAQDGKICVLALRLLRRGKPNICMHLNILYKICASWCGILSNFPWGI